MSFRFLESLLIIAALLFCASKATLGATSGSDSGELRVCADPDNLPFSNIRQEGFENRIAELIARDLNLHLSYVWQRMGRGFVREYLNKSRCDVLIGIPVRYGPVATTAPYYRSSYVFVTRKHGKLHPASLDDPILRESKIGIQAVDEEYTPPAQALARRGMQNSLVGFYGVGAHAADVVRAVAARKVDLAVVWGPTAGYAARRFRELEVRLVTPEMDPPGLPLTFEIAMGVRKGNDALRRELDTALQRHRPEIQRILSSYGVPQLELISRTQADN